MNTDQPTLSIGEAARMLAVSVDTLRTWEAKGKIAGHRTAGNQRRFPVAEVERVKALAATKATA